MDYVKQAFELSADKKQSAVEIYERAVTVFVNKNYLPLCEDAHVDLSAIFGQIWLMTQRGSGAFWMDAALYAEANVAFNYANFLLGVRGEFVKTAKRIVKKEERVTDLCLMQLAKQMNCILMATTAEKCDAHFERKYA